MPPLPAKRWLMKYHKAKKTRVGATQPSASTSQFDSWIRL
jgi:hypothetical protein